VPLSGSVPLHAPLATQAVALVLVHVSIEFPFVLIEDGEADRVTLGLVGVDVPEPLESL
jgi:hypothetical protein